MVDEVDENGYYKPTMGSTAEENAAMVANSSSEGGNSSNPTSSSVTSPSADTSADAAAGAGSGGGAEDLYYPSEIQNANIGESSINHHILFETYELTVDSINSSIDKIKSKLESGSIKSAADVGSVVGEFIAGQPSRVTKRISMYMPSQIINKIGINYQTTSFQFIDNVIALATEGVSNLTPGQYFGAGAAILASVSSSLATTLTSLISQAPIVGGVTGKGLELLGGGVAKELAQAIQKKTGVAINPRITTLFKNPELRNFSFNFIFSPRNGNEAAMVDKIITHFKASSLPKSFGAGSFFSFPNEFRIICKTGGNDNPYMFKTKRCVITGIEVNHTPSTLFNAFGKSTGKEGMPTQSILSLNFTETEVLTSDDITSKTAY